MLSVLDFIRKELLEESIKKKEKELKRVVRNPFQLTQQRWKEVRKWEKGKKVGGVF